MTQPSISSVHVSRPLTNISIAYVQQQTSFVADQVFPNIPVTKSRDSYYAYDRSFWNRDEMAVRAPGTESSSAGYEVNADQSYYTPVRGFKVPIPDQQVSDQDDVLDARTDATEFATLKALLHREKNWADNFFTTGVWATDDTSQDWSDAASEPIEVIRTAKRTVQQTTGFKPNTLVLGKEAYDVLVDHPDIIDRVKYGQTAGRPARGTLEALQDLFEIERILVMEAIINNAAEGLTESNAFIAGANALLCYVNPTPRRRMPSAGYTFSWTGYLGATDRGYRIKNYRDEPKAADIVEIEMAFDQKLIGADLGYFFSAVTS